MDIACSGLPASKKFAGKNIKTKANKNASTITMPFPILALNIYKNYYK